MVRNIKYYNTQCRLIEFTKRGFRDNKMLSPKAF